ncbi:hypothetical protein [Lysinibacillus sp. FSL K6-3209]|uniref:hypothetical protein n=1 Tax=Lysinibacillus sp. FSL K6-3209 TaxID=2921497 RepID=UPI0030DC031E
MKLLKIVLSLLIVLVGSFFLNTTVKDEFFKNIVLDILGVMFLFVGLFYLVKTMKVPR